MYKTVTLFFIGCFVCYHLSAQKRFINMDSTKIWVNTIGLEGRKAGQPVVVFVSGLGTPMGNWDRVLDGVAAMAPVITYDRPGIGESEPDDEMPTIKNVADKLVRVLDHVKMEPPYVLVGHSLGGLYVRGFAIYYPEKLAGLVIIDPADFTENKQNIREYYKVLDCDEARIDQKITEVTAGLVKRNEGTPKPIQRERNVLLALRQSDFKEITDHPLPKNLPVHILTGGRFDMPQNMRSKEYDEEKLFRSKMHHRVARWTEVIQSVDKGMIMYSGDAGHFVHWDDPELAISSIRIVLQDYETIKAKQTNDEE